MPASVIKWHTFALHVGMIENSVTNVKLVSKQFTGRQKFYKVYVMLPFISTSNHELDLNRRNSICNDNYVACEQLKCARMCGRDTLSNNYFYYKHYL